MDLIDRPLLLAVVSLIILAASAVLGAVMARRRRDAQTAEREDFSLVLGATLTLLGLIIGFTFSMALTRYDQRKDYEEGEANAIGTELLRADLLSGADAARVRALLLEYTKQRIAYFTTTDRHEVDAINRRTSALQNDLWTTVRTSAAGNPTPLTALVVAGMNDVLNAQGYTQAAWWNRIPRAAWLLMVFMALSATFLVGYGSKNGQSERGVLMVLPVIVSVAFFLIADIESPRGGFIRIAPQNLLSLEASMRAP